MAFYTYHVAARSLGNGEHQIFSQVGEAVIVPARALFDGLI